MLNVKGTWPPGYAYDLWAGLGRTTLDSVTNKLGVAGKQKTVPTNIYGQHSQVSKSCYS